MTSYECTMSRLDSLLADRRADPPAITLPPHQREYVWKPRQQKKLVQTVCARMLMPPIVIRSIRTSTGAMSQSLEDGQQRLTTLERFFQNQFTDSSGRTFRQLSEIEQERFNSYMVPVMKYSNATDEQAITTFNNLQNGTALSVGERILSMAPLSPIIKFAVEQLLTADTGFYNRTLPFWGPRTPKAKRGMNTTYALAIVAGLAFGSRYISSKWSDIEDIIGKPLQRAQLLSDLDTLIKFFEDVHLANPVPDRAQKVYWDPGMFTGYIIHAMKLDTTLLKSLTEPANVPVLPTRKVTMTKFKELLIEHSRRPEVLEETLHKDIDAARFWKLERWHNGWRRLFYPESFTTVPPAAADEEEEEL